MFVPFWPIFEKPLFCPMDSLFNYNTVGQVTHSPKEQANHCRKIGCILLFISCKIYIKKKSLKLEFNKRYVYKFLFSKVEMLSFAFLIFKLVSE